MSGPITAPKTLEAFLDYKRLARRSERTLDQHERDLARQFILNPEKTLEEFTSEDLLAVLTSPMLRVPTIPREPPQVLEIFRDAEEGALCVVPELRDRALTLILLGAGIRDGEARLLRLRDVDLEARTLHVRGKGRRDRLIPLPRRVVHAVAQLAVLDGLAEDDHLWYRQKANEYARPVLGNARSSIPASTAGGHEPST
jgi:integrase